MNSVFKWVLLLFFPAALFAQSASSAFPAQIKNVVVMVQENRTPDNLFQGLSPHCPNSDLTGCYDIQSFYNIAVSPAVQMQVQLAPVGLATNFDLSHSHSNFLFEKANQNPGAAVQPGCGSDVFGCAASTWNQFMFVDNTHVKNFDGSPGGLLDPYLTFATQYGWANLMYQTNQGPSYPAHQFLFSGTSALSATDDANSTFISENFSASSAAGCLAPNGASSFQLSPTASCPNLECKLTNIVTSGNPVGTFCVVPANAGGHNSMADLLEAAGVSWKYYAPSPGSIWTAPDANQAICNPQCDATSPGTTNCTKLSCTGPEWNQHVDTSNLGTDILTDIASCRLSNVSWVIPNGTWSDHASSNHGLGPAWVAAVINAIGSSSCGYWQNTAIVVTWDDWGGWFDHETPFVSNPQPPCMTNNCPGDYQRGFRVPLIVVSAYTPQGTINNTKHDFGSILRMIQGINGIPEGSLGFADARITNDLRDFFSASMTARTYTPVPAVVPASFFTGQAQSGAPAVVPDEDN
jgi:phospholipase C